MEWEPTRAAGLRHLEEFVPRAGRDYAAWRNFDRGRFERRTVSGLSPWLRHRLVSEPELVACVLRAHGEGSAEKFVQEIFWRTYWKGWLEMRPSVWRDYERACKADVRNMDRASTLRSLYEDAVNGRTGIEAFDVWSRNLVETGYLHNHARMWFASIWIFTLRLPWTLGADFFLRHLLDGDPASNTLSWRWVAGLQTRGKHYLATRENIERFTEGRFSPTGLNESAEPLEGPPPPDPTPLPALDPLPDASWFLVLTEDDCLPEDFALPSRRPEGIAALSTTQGRSPLPVAKPVHAFAGGALLDAGRRATGHFEDVEAVAPGDEKRVLAAIRSSGAAIVVAPYAPVGPAADAIARLAGTLHDLDIPMFRLRRDWDERAWPLATAGFFRFRKSVPDLITAAGIAIR